MRSFRVGDRLPGVQGLVEEGQLGLEALKLLVGDFVEEAEDAFRRNLVLDGLEGFLDGRGVLARVELGPRLGGGAVLQREEAGAGEFDASRAASSGPPFPSR